MKSLVQILYIGVVVLFAAAASAGTIDTFEGAATETEGWVAGGGPVGSFPPVPPEVVPTGGPGGAGDGYLQITSGGGAGPGSRLTAFNLGQWAGNYLASGLPHIEMDLINLGQTELTIRLEFENPFQAIPDLAVSNTGITLTPGSGWTHAVFSLNPANFTALSGTIAGALGNTTVLRILHASGPTAAEPIAGQLGVDNIAAIPEPATLLITAAGLTFLLARMRFRRL